VEQRHLEPFTSGSVGDGSACLVALLGLGVPAFQRTQEEGVRIPAHGGRIRMRVQRTVPEDKLVVDGIQTPLAILDRERRDAVELCSECGAGGIADREQGRGPKWLRG
jgi:hypothetical protein